MQTAQAPDQIKRSIATLRNARGEETRQGKRKRALRNSNLLRSGRRMSLVLGAMIAVDVDELMGSAGLRGWRGLRQSVATRQCGGIHGVAGSFQSALPARLSVLWVKPFRRFIDIRLGPALSALFVPEFHGQKKNYQDTIISVPFMFPMAESSCKKRLSQSVSRRSHLIFARIAPAIRG